MQIARRRKERGLKLNYAEAIALVCEVLLEAARDGKSLSEITAIGKQVLKRDDVLEGVPEMVNLIQIEATLRTGTQLITIPDPISRDRLNPSAV